MRLKYYLRGAALGIIVTTLILTVSYAFADNKETMSDEEVLERAAELGWVDGTTIEDESTDSTEEDEAKTEDDKTDSAASKTDKDSENASSSTSSSKGSSSTTSSSADSTSSSGESTSTVTYVPFTVSGGESSNTVAAHLEEAGLVDDAEAFNDYMNKLGIDNLIQAGTFYVASDSDYEDLVAALVTKQDKRMTSPPKAD